ncbi:hypothetical protein GGF31_002768 [Allomyces arbusculus]|nr:hypothetical protein GGF31_002768 [Allomyces arbusculus]
MSNQHTAPLVITITDPMVTAFCRSNPQFNPEAVLVHTVSLLKSLNQDHSKESLYKDLSGLVTGMFDKMMADLTKTRTAADTAMVSRIEQSLAHRNVDKIMYDRLSGLEQALQSYTLSSVPGMVRTEMDRVKATIDRVLNDTSTIQDLKTGMSLVLERMSSTQSLDEEKLRALAMHIEHSIDRNLSTNPKIGSIEHALHTFMGSVLPNLLSSEVSGIMNALAGVTNHTASVSEMNRVLQSISEKLGVASQKGSAAEELTYETLMQYFPTHIITRVASRDQKGHADIAMEQAGKPKILVEVKLYKGVVGKSEIEKMERDVTMAKAHGIFVSQNSRIQGKNHFHIDIIQDKYAVVYLSNIQFAAEPLVSAVSIIYELDALLTKFADESEDSSALHLDEAALRQISSVLDSTQSSLSDIERSLKETIANVRAVSLTQIRAILAFL